MKTAETTRVTIPISGMTCAACQSFVQRSLQEQPGVVDATVNLLLNNATVSYDEAQTSPETLVEAIRETGYDADLPTLGDQDDAIASQHHEYAVLRWKAGITLILGAIAMFVPLPAPILMAIAVFVMVWAGRRFYVKAWTALKHKTSDMNTLIALGTGAAFLYSGVVTLWPAYFVARGIPPHVYYEAVIVILGLILTGNMLEGRAKVRTTEALRKLASLQPTTAHVEREGTDVEIPIAQLRRGDVVVVRPGERVTSDGIVLSGNSAVDESMITGESMPVDKLAGDPVTGGTLNGPGFLRIEVTNLGSASTLGQIVRLLRDAQGSRAPVQNLADRISAIFVPAVILIAVITFIVWYALANSAAGTHALVAAVAVLVIACPCAMGLATPTAIMVATGRSAQKGILMKGGEPIQKLSSVDTVVLDKTGTITEGQLKVLEFVPAAHDADNALHLIASLEHASEHPVAKAILRYANADGRSLSHVGDFAALSGMGASGRVGGVSVVIGNRSLMDQYGIDFASLEPTAHQFGAQGRTAIYAAIAGKPAGVFAVADSVKPGSRDAVAALKKLGLKVLMITGDHVSTANAIAAEVGISEVVAGVLPKAKIDAIKDLQKQGRTVAMVGDGINDAPALAQADVGIAMATGADVAIEAGDVTLMSGDLRNVVAAIKLAKSTMRVMKQNLFWAFAYNLVGIPIAAGVLYPAFGIQLSPMVASAAMALSSVSVVTNSLRLSRA